MTPAKAHLDSQATSTMPQPFLVRRRHRGERQIPPTRRPNRTESGLPYARQRARQRHTDCSVATLARRPGQRMHMFCPVVPPARKASHCPPRAVSPLAPIPEVAHGPTREARRGIGVRTSGVAAPVRLRWSPTHRAAHRASSRPPELVPRILPNCGRRVACALKSACSFSVGLISQGARLEVERNRPEWFRSGQSHEARARRRVVCGRGSHSADVFLAVFRPRKLHRPSPSIT